MKDKTYKLIKDWFHNKTGVSLMHDPSLVSLVNEIEALGLAANRSCVLLTLNFKLKNK